MIGDRILKHLASEKRPLTCNQIAILAGMLRAGGPEYMEIQRLHQEGLIRLAATPGKRKRWELTDRGRERAAILLRRTRTEPSAIHGGHT